MTEDLDEQELKRYLSLFQEKVTKQLEIVSYESVGHPLYHISTFKQASLVPNISRRSALSEDNTIPRVHTSRNLLGCISSISNMSYTVMNMPNTDKKNSKDYKGGWYIHAVPFKKALKPSTRLVFDAARTDETWLVGYSPNYKEYPVAVIGKVIPVGINFTPRDGKLPIETITVQIEVSDETGCYLTDKDYLAKGYWQAVLLIESKSNKAKIKSIVAIEKSVFMRSKEISATMLSFQSPVMSW